MCGICFICTLSGNQAKNLNFNLSRDKITSDDDPDHDDHPGTSSIDNNDIDGCAANKKHESFVNNIFTDALLHHRGPDVSTEHAFTLTKGLYGYMQGCVLHLRGQITPQPVKDSKGNALMWNGEIFDGIKVEDHENDTQVLFNHLVSSITEEDILKTMQKVHGPWAFIFWQADAQKLWFGRDMFGRRSLLWHLPLSINDHLVLSSVALGEMTYTEIPSVGIFCLDFNKVYLPGGDSPECSLLTLYPWKCCKWPGTSVTVTGTKDTDILKYLYPNCSTYLSVNIDNRGLLDIWIPEVNKHLPQTEACLLNLDSDIANNACLEDMLTYILKNRNDLDELAEELIKVLQISVYKRINNLPREYSIIRDSPGVAQNHYDLCAVHSNHKTYSTGLDYEMCRLNCSESSNLISFANVAILFSGGLDSTILAALADRCVPEGESIDLLNVAFEQPAVKCPSKKKHKEKKTKQKKKPERRQHISGSHESARHPTHLSQSGDASESSKHHCERSSSIASQSHLSTQGCCLNISSADQLTSSQDLSCACPGISDHSHICSEVDSNALHNSDSQNFNKDITPNASCSSSYDVPDRQTGRIALSELNPKRKWNFVEINISQAELHAVRNSHIRRLIYPLQTVLDDSIGCAVWFAARGSGDLANDKNQKFVSRARVILCGMAADEQFAGYSRHRVTYNTKGLEELLRELQEEMWRISSRNLGRDDRIITDHGKECRFPFLDETFTQLVSSIPIHKRADLRLPRGVGDKLLLRLCALKLGLVKTAAQPKRAIQFGSKIAKLDNRKEKGSDVCDRLV